MSKRSDRPQSRRHILVYDEDWEWLERHAAIHNLGVGQTIREIVHARVKLMRERMEGAMTA